MKVLVFGASGFIGSHLTCLFEEKGHDVTAFCRSGKVPGFNGRAVVWDLDTPPVGDSLDGSFLAVHLAHDFKGAKGADRTYRRTVELSERLRDHSVERQVFYSSYSAGQHASSLYGRTKFELEKELGRHDDTVIIRPGLVLGDGGIYGRIKAWAERFPLVPLPDGGTGRLPVITVQRLCEITIEAGLSPSPPKCLNAFEKELVPLRKLVTDAASSKGKKTIVVPIPSKPLLLALKLGSLLRLPLPVNEDNLRGFLANQSASHESHL
jgi:uncharacterized protein YbjT (DUF2867 family)